LIGVGGTYGIIADAYRTAAAQVNMLPREMQSITWEAVRGLFNADIKNTIKPKIRAEWEKYKKGELSFEQARENAVKIATTAQGVTDNKIPEPDWKDSGKGRFVSSGGTSYDKSFKPEGGVRLRPKESIREKLSVNLAAVTESIPGLAELYARAKGKDLNAYKLLQRVAEARLRFLLGGTGAKITVDDIKGVFLGDREPSIASIIAFDESEMKPVLAALAQFAESFNQIQVHVRQPTAYDFGHKYGDGSYVDNFRRTYAVDAGLIGAIKLEDIRDSELERIVTNKLGNIHEFASELQDYDVYDYKGLLAFGDVEIETGDGMWEEDEIEIEDEDA
jgi:hypothetical protein